MMRLWGKRMILLGGEENDEVVGEENYVKLGKYNNFDEMNEWSNIHC